MLLRMYLRWGEQHGYKVEWLEESSGEEAGLVSDYTGQWRGCVRLAENGNRRSSIVRISPYDAAARRHTSFASISAYPVIDDTIDIVINDKDLRVDTIAPGAGGQHVNRTTALSHDPHTDWNCRAMPE